MNLTFDALIEIIDTGKIRIFLSNVIFNRKKNDNSKRVSISFSKKDGTVFRKAYLG